MSRNKNVLADRISKSVDYDDWGVSEDFFFQFIDNMWGPHEVDRFAIYHDCSDYAKLSKMAICLSVSQ